MSFIVVLVSLSLSDYLLNMLDWVVVELNETRWIFVCVDDIRSFLMELVLFSFVGVLDCLRLFLEVFQLSLYRLIWLIYL